MLRYRRSAGSIFMINMPLCIILDAAGVIFRAAEDVADILIPLIAEATGKERNIRK